MFLFHTIWNFKINVRIIIAIVLFLSFSIQKSSSYCIIHFSNVNETETWWKEKKHLKFKQIILVCCFFFLNRIFFFYNHKLNRFKNFKFPLKKEHAIFLNTNWLPELLSSSRLKTNPESFATKNFFKSVLTLGKVTYGGEFQLFNSFFLIILLFDNNLENLV